MTFAPKTGNKSNSAKALLFTILLATAGFVLYFNLRSTAWIIPEEVKRVKNPLTASPAALQSGRRAYLDKCAECHGDSGKGDGSQAKMYSTRPSNLTDKRHLDAETDGELFYKITHGHKPMPGFAKRLSDEQRWQIVLLIRELSHSTSPNPPQN